MGRTATAGPLRHPAPSQGAAAPPSCARACLPPHSSQLSASTGQLLQRRHRAPEGKGKPSPRSRQALLHTPWGRAWPGRAPQCAASRKRCSQEAGGTPKPAATEGSQWCPWAFSTEQSQPLRPARHRHAGCKHRACSGCQCCVREEAREKRREELTVSCRTAPVLRTSP